MKSFKTFLKEMPTMINSLDKKGGDIRGKKVGSKVEDYNSDYELHAVPHNDENHQSEFSLVHKPTGKVHMRISGRFHDDLPNTFIVGSLHGSTKSTVRGHELYHHLITKRGLTMVSDTLQSKGGAHTWEKLSHYPDVNVKHVMHGQEQEPEKDWSKNYAAVDATAYHPLRYSYFIGRKK